MITLNQWFDKGLTTEEYMSQMTSHKDNMEQVMQEFKLPDDQAFFEQLASRNLRAIVITEDWCGDAMMNNPILLSLCKAANMDIRFILRDKHTELMDQYLTNGTARSIPIFIFINEQGEEMAKWGPRASKIQSFVDEARSQLPAKEDEAFKAGQELLIAQLTAAYKEREDFWLEVYKELKETLQPL